MIVVPGSMPKIILSVANLLFIRYFIILNSLTKLSNSGR